MVLKLNSKQKKKEERLMVKNRKTITKENHNLTPYYAKAIDPLSIPDVEPGAILPHLIHDVHDDRVICSKCNKLIIIKDSDTVSDGVGEVSFKVCLPCRLGL
jgi:hypothetical protein